MPAFLTSSLRKVAAWFGGREPVVLLAIVLVVAAVWGFIKVTDEVLEGETEHFDRSVVLAMRQADDPSLPIGPEWLQEMGRDATAFGGVAALTFFTAAAVGYLWIDRKFRMMALLLGATFSGLLLSTALKSFVSRPRPDIVPHLAHVYTSSFPSGHSMLSAVVYLMIGSLLAAATPHVRLKIYMLAVAIVLSLAVGISRVYLGVHYPTDVLAGWMAGAAWAFVCWLIAHWLQRHRSIER